MKTRWLLLVLSLGLLPTLARADVKPNTICSEGMVLQQKSNAKVWGSADKGEMVTVTFRGKTASTKADDSGAWVVSIPTGEAGGPFELTIKGNNTIAYKNILVGEVWICSGQSNMNWRISQCDKSDQEFASSAPPNPMLRMFTVAFNPQADPKTSANGAWAEAKPQTVGGFSAVGYFFGRNLQEDLKIPVGLIHTSVGGTRIEAWMSKSALEAVGVKEGEAKKVNQNTASALYNGMVHPILNYGVKGAIWYQGESNAGNAFKYRTLHPAMIEQWRADFKNPDLAFYFVQLAPYTPISKTPGESNWAELREAQAMTLKLKNTGMAVITDFGDEFDIHPTPKRPVGERLALAAQAQTYGEKIVYSGPMFKSAKFNGKNAVLQFDHFGGGLIAKEMVAMPSGHPKAPPTLKAYRAKDGSSKTPLLGFAISGKDGKFYPAQATIVDDTSPVNTVVVSSDMVAEPIAVRYGWANHPVCNLFNREGLPASPFRTDDFPGVTQPKTKQ